MKKTLFFILYFLFITYYCYAETIFTPCIVGQSNGGQMTCPYNYFPGYSLSDGCNTSTANANVYMWNNTVSSVGNTWISPGTGSGSDSAGLVALGNAINNATGWTVHMINISFGSSFIFGDESNGSLPWWWNSNNTPSTDAQTGFTGESYASAKARVVAANGGHCDVIILMNGEGEGTHVYPSSCPSATCYGNTPSSPNIWTQSWYTTHYTAFLNQLRTDFGNVPIIQSQIATTIMTGSQYGLDASWSNVREFNKAFVASYGSHAYIGDCTVNFALGSGGVHWTATGYAKAGQMIAQTILYDKGYVPWYKGPTITGLNAVDSIHTDILIQHSGGTDFTPTSSITGFAETCGGSPLTISTAVRQTATSIRLTHGACYDTRMATYMFGIYPNVSGVVDNSFLTYPLEPNINITQVTLPPTYSPIITGSGLAPVKTGSGLAPVKVN